MSVVHIAPEPSLTAAIKSTGCKYMSGDIVPSKGRSKIDIRNMSVASRSVDVFVCSHVLEHVLDDFTAMQEICRVLKPSGVAILQVPIAKNKRTFRDPSANTAEMRKRAHGQHNHVRIYGSIDYPILLQAAGLRYDPYKATEEDAKEFNLSKESELHTCYKTSGL
jgi:ubiquinone/menaquinone biosynthesis C-methylase UbiE